jgi:hypothetical protein
MKAFVVAMVIASLAGSAYAQDASSPGGKRGKGHRAQNAEQQPKKKPDDSAYKSALKSIPDQPQPTDPWGNLRKVSH